MNELQITLICILGILGIAFFIVIFMRINESIKTGNIVHKKKVKSVMEILEKDLSTQDQWDNIWPLFYKNGQIDYSKIDATLTYVINHKCDDRLKKNATQLLKERIAITVFGDDEMTDAIEAFNNTINQCGNQEIKDAGHILIKQVQRFCRQNVNNNKYDLIIQWIFNAIEVVGLILAIITL